MTLGSNIKKIRKEANMSQEDFAEKFHVSRQTISNWENSKSYPDLETIVNISDCFNVSLDILLKEDLIMVKTFDSEIKNTKKYAKVLLAMAVVFAIVIVSFAVYSCVYFSTKNKLEDNFSQQLKEHGFYKNRDEYYSMDYADGVVFGVPNQSMPPLTDFSLHFYFSNIYCDVELDDSHINIVWENYNDFYASAISKDDNRIIGSTSKFKKGDFSDTKKLSEELNISEEKIKEIIDKGNELYEDFYQ